MLFRRSLTDAVSIMSVSSPPGSLMVLSCACCGRVINVQRKRTRLIVISTPLPRALANARTRFLEASSKPSWMLPNAMAAASFACKLELHKAERALLGLISPVVRAQVGVELNQTTSVARHGDIVR